jgi:aspartate/methionine/tyrosine aminotransferase
LVVRARLARFIPRARRLTENGTTFLRYYSDRVLTAPVEELLDPAYVPDACGPEVIDLNQPAPRNEAGVSPGRFSTQRWGGNSARGLGELREAIAARCERLEERKLDPESEVLVTHGATGAYAAALDAFVNAGDRVVLFDPCSPLFALGAKSRRARVRWVSTWMEDARCRYLAADFEKAMRGAKMLVFANPGNPAGGCFKQEDFAHIAWIAAAYDVLIYVDRSFDRFHYGDRSEPLSAVAGFDQRLLSAGSLTHEHGMGGLRVGWLTGHRHLVRAGGLMANLAAPFVPVACQQAAVKALTSPDDTFASVLDRFRCKRDYTIDRLQGMGLEADRPAGGFFAWVPVAGLGLSGRVFAEKLFREEQVQVGPGCAFGPGGEGHIRISFATDEGRLRAGLARMAAFIDRLKAPPSMPVSEDEPRSEAAEADRPKPTFSRV